MQGQPKRPNVLIVDDEPAILITVRAVLEDEFHVLTAGDGESALQILDQEEVAVVISDQRMRGLTGDQFLQRAAAASGAVRILATAYSDVDALVRAINLGRIFAYVSKPWDPAALRQLVRRAADQYQERIAAENERGLLRAVLDSTPDRVYFTDGAGRYTRVNQAHAAYLGLARPEEAVGKTEADFLPAAAAEATAAEEKEVRQSQRRILDRVERRPDADGRMRWYSSTKIPHGDGVLALIRDVSERKREEEAGLRAAQERFSSVFELGGVGIAIAGAEGRLLEANPALAQMVGRAVDDLAGRSLSELVAPADAARLAERFGEMADGRIASFRETCTFLTAGGEQRPARLTGTLLRERAGTVLLMAM